MGACLCAEAGRTSDEVELKFALPGRERQFSVLNGLKVYTSNDTWHVIIWKFKYISSLEMLIATGNI